MFKVKIRGIYSTALTKLLLENGFEIVQPSLSIKQRFKLLDNVETPELKIKDRYDLQGIRALGSRDAIDTLQSILQKKFDDVLTRRWQVSVDGIYKGKIVKTDYTAIYVDLGNEIVGTLEKNVENPPDTLVVQVERKRGGTRHPTLTTDLKIVGEYAILTQNGRIGVSLKIRDLNKRAELYTLGKSLAPKSWGIIWREAAATKPTEALKSEVMKLMEKAKILEKKASDVNAPSLLVEGSYAMDVEFPYFSKKELDKLRESVTPTLAGHHFYKSCGGNVSAMLEMAEKLLENGEGEVERSFKEQVRQEFPSEGDVVNIEHVKLSGAVFHLGQAELEKFDEDQIIYSRIMQSNGTYDGIDAIKERGDRALSQARIGEWYIITKYFSTDGTWKGTYLNVNTPIEVYPNALRYVDLEVDICICKDSSIKVLDMEKLKKALEKGYISKEFFEKIVEKVERLAEVLKEGNSVI